MLKQATTVHLRVPGIHIDPFLLAESQAGDSHGIVLIAYNGPPFDLLFLEGPRISLAARWGPDYKFILDPAYIKEKFQALRTSVGTSVSFFTVTGETLTSFIATLYFEPFLRCDLAPLNRRQRIALLTKNVRPGTLMEIDCFSSFPPAVQLVPLDPSEGIRKVRPLPQSGILSLYDTTLNAALLEEKKLMGMLPRQVPHRPAEPPTPGPSLPDPSQQELFPSPVNTIADLTPAEPLPSRPPLTTGLLPEEARFIAVMKNFLTHFRHELHEELGKSAVPLLDRAERKVNALIHGFDRTRLDMDTAHFTLDYLKFATMAARFPNRRKVRQIAVFALGELYAKHYEEIEKFKVLDKIESLYAKFKGDLKNGLLFRPT